MTIVTKCRECKGEGMVAIGKLDSFGNTVYPSKATMFMQCGECEGDGVVTIEAGES